MPAVFGALTCRLYLPVAEGLRGCLSLCSSCLQVGPREHGRSGGVPGRSGQRRALTVIVLRGGRLEAVAGRRRLDGWSPEQTEWERSPLTALGLVAASD